MILITSADQYIGYTITSHLAQHKSLRQEQLRILCENKQGCYGFLNAGVDVCQVDYSHPNLISHALRGVDHIILAIGSDPDRVKHAAMICNLAAHSGVSSIICISHIGCTASSQRYLSLQEFSEIEQIVMNSSCQYTILRLDFVQQYFHLWSNYAEKHRAIILPMAEDKEICPIDIEDVCKVIEILVLDNESHLCKPYLEDKHDGQVYILTGPESMNGKQLVEKLAESTGYHQFKYLYSRPMDISYYLTGLGKDVLFDARLKHERYQIYHDTFDDKAYKTKAYAYPSDNQIQLFLDYFNWVQHTSGSIYVSHTSMLTKTSCQTIQEFFKRNANSFKPRV
ncbi:uncharacterized protein BX663DRAFT_496152 [Cokeromyces recurvatus]|uniref:uncharacterized protein n=1 Tax=Cokeromyces recurvatus TaxID=90255 RepID=UPI002220069B|nr:uncharacterized protein BX663DRAFT_496152 [Cokeromyces recurvatus]KAI7906363.1 hypothetical protein BX663DRAFT_496152 [Cokeromyces recurvatus]